MVEASAKEPASEMAAPAAADGLVGSGCSWAGCSPRLGCTRTCWCCCALSRLRTASVCSMLCSFWSSEVSAPDRKSTRLNSSHVKTSYAVFGLKKKSGERRGWREGGERREG